MKLLFGLLALAVVVSLLLFFRSSSPPPFEEVHIHADFAIYVDATRIDLSDALFQSTDERYRHIDLHLHEGEGSVLHIHAADKRFAEFLASLGILLDAECLSLRDRYCREDGLQMFVNGSPFQSPFTRYVPNDLDQILLTTSTDETVIAKQLSEVTDKACLYSLSCPERGVLEFQETCVSGEVCSVPPKIEPLTAERSYSHF